MQPLDNTGGLAGARTRDQRIKSNVPHYMQMGFCLTIKSLRFAWSALKPLFCTEYVKKSPT